MVWSNLNNYVKERNTIFNLIKTLKTFKASPSVIVQVTIEPNALNMWEK